MPWTPTFASATTFTVTWDITAYVAKWMIIKWNDTWGSNKVWMVSIPSTYWAPNTTITIIWDTIVDSITASTMKYAFVWAECFIEKFAIAWAVWATWTDIANCFYTKEPMRILWAELQVWTVASTSWNTTVDINGSTIWTIFTVAWSIVKPVIAYNALTVATPFSATTSLSSVLNERFTLDIDWVTSTTFPTDLYVQVYLFPSRLINLT
jgi:hypothetical protein